MLGGVASVCWNWKEQDAETIWEMARNFDSHCMIHWLFIDCQPLLELFNTGRGELFQVHALSRSHHVCVNQICRIDPEKCIPRGHVHKSHDDVQWSPRPFVLVDGRSEHRDYSRFSRDVAAPSFQKHSKLALPAVCEIHVRCTSIVSTQAQIALRPVFVLSLVLEWKREMEG